MPNVRLQTLALLRGIQEALVLLLVILSPWAFGCVHPLLEMVLFGGLAILLSLWSLCLLLDDKTIWPACPVAGCLAGLFVLGVWQITPLPPATLAWIAPGNIALQNRLGPETQEILTGEKAAESVPTKSGSTISLYPGRTRALVIELLGVLLLFTLVRQQIASPASARRLAFFALVNGFFLAFVGVLQFFSSPHNVLYWTFPSLGAVFGPFVCRNNFASYINLCIGMGIGLLLVNSKSRDTGSEGILTIEDAPGERPGSSSGLWIGAAVAFMIAGLALSLSRGGLLALLGAGVVITVVINRGSGRAARLGVILLIVSLALGLVVWFGFDLVEARMATLWKGQALRESRVPLWERTLPWFLDFPVWGAGFGTFLYLEPIRRQPGSDPGYYYDHAHNDYLELLVEGGAVGLVLGMVAIVLIYRIGWRGLLEHKLGTTRGLVLGALLAFTTLVLHSFTDFGLHIPAVAVLATVLAAQLCGLGSPGRIATASADSWTQSIFSRLVTAMGLVWVAVLLFGEARWADQAERYRLAALRYEGGKELEGRARQIAYLQAATTIAPANAGLQVALADAYYDTFLLEEVRVAAQTELVAALQVWATNGLARSGFSAPAETAGVIVVTVAIWRDSLVRSRTRIKKEYLIPALARYRLARDLCPLLERPHLRFAAYSQDTEVIFRADPPEDYLVRARFLLPHEGQIWFLSGMQELEEGKSEQAWQSWRRSLVCSPQLLGTILDRSQGHLEPQEVIHRILPDDSGLLFEAAMHHAKRQEDAGTPFLEKALQLLEGRRTRLTTASLAMKANIHQRLNQSLKALETYRELVGRDPGQWAWRMELARLLYENGRLQESRRELRVLLDEQPRNQAAKNLFERVHEQIAVGTGDRAAPR